MIVSGAARAQRNLQLTIEASKVRSPPQPTDSKPLALPEIDDDVAVKSKALRRQRQLKEQQREAMVIEAAKKDLVAASTERHGDDNDADAEKPGLQTPMAIISARANQKTGLSVREEELTVQGRFTRSKDEGSEGDEGSAASSNSARKRASTEMSVAGTCATAGHHRHHGPAAIAPRKMVRSGSGGGVTEDRTSLAARTTGKKAAKWAGAAAASPGEKRRQRNLGEPQGEAPNAFAAARESEIREVEAHAREVQRASQFGKLPKLRVPAASLRPPVRNNSSKALRSNTPPEDAAPPPAAIAVSSVAGPLLPALVPPVGSSTSLPHADDSNDAGGGVGSFSPGSTMDQQHRAEFRLRVTDQDVTHLLVDPPTSGVLRGNDSTNATAAQQLKQSFGGTASFHAKHPAHCLYGRRLQRRLAHPLQEERAFFDVWPANNKAGMLALTNLSRGTGGGTLGATLEHQESVFSRPQLLLDMEDAIRAQLQRLGTRFPRLGPCTNAVNPPSDDQLSPRRWAASSYGLAFARAEKAAHRHTGNDRGKAASTPSPDMGGRGGGDAADGVLAVLENTAGSVAAPGAHYPPLAFESLCSPEDEYRAERIAIFSAAAKDFADQFKSYRRLLLWMVTEFDGFSQYCHANVLSPDARLRFQEETAKAAEVRAQVMLDAAEATRLKAEAESIDLRASLAGLQSKAATHEAVMREKDRLIAAKDAELAEAAAGRAALLSRIDRLERELWDQKNVLEGPERRIAELTRTVRDQDEKLRQAAVVFQDNDKEKAVLRARVERLEDGLRERQKAGAGGSTLTRGELMAWKKRENDLVEAIANLQSRTQRAEQRVKDLNDAVAAARDARDSSMTPRPHWHDFDDVLPRAPSSAKRTVAAAAAVRREMELREQALEDLNELRDLISTQPRQEGSGALSEHGRDAARLGQPLGSPATGALAAGYLSEDVVPAMLAPFFVKFGLDSKVPSFLKGTGIAANLHLDRFTMQGLVRLFVLERGDGKAGLPTDQFCSKFLQKYCPESASADAFAYSFYHALHWFGYDLWIGFVRRLVAGTMEDLVLIDMTAGAKALRERLTIDALQKAKEDERPTSQLVLPKANFISALIELLPQKEEGEVKRLVVAAAKDSPGKDIDIPSVFGFSAPERHFSHFLEEFYCSYLDARKALLEEMTLMVGQCDTDDEGFLSPPNVAALLWQVDPDIPAVAMDGLLATLFTCTVDALFPSVTTETGVKHVGAAGERTYGCGDTVTCDLPTVLQRLHDTVLRRYSKGAGRKRQRAAAVAAVAAKGDTATAHRRSSKVDGNSPLLSAGAAGGHAAATAAPTAFPDSPPKDSSPPPPS